MTATATNPYARIAAENPLWPELRMAVEPPLELNGAEYAERYLYLPGTEGERGGKFSFDANPAQRAPLESMTSPYARSTVVMCPPQIGKTTMLIAFAAWVMRCQPASVIWTQPDWSDVSHMFQNRLKLVIEETPDLVREAAGMQITGRRIILPSGARFFGASGRAANSMRGKPAQIAVSDEVSAFPVVSKASEGANPLELIDNRLLSFQRRHHVMTSTPVLADDAFDQAFEDSDQRAFWVPCPHCGVFQVLDEKQLRWVDGIAARDVRRDGGVRYLCASCDKPIADEQKLPAMRRGVWVPTGVGIDPRNGKVEAHREHDQHGYHLSALNSPTLKWADYVAAIIRARQSPRRHAQTLENFWRARPWRPTVTGTVVLPASRRIAYLRGTVPEHYLMLTAGVDVQVDHMVWVIRAWSWDEQSWLVDHGVAADWPALDAALFQPTWKVGPVPDLVTEGPRNPGAKPRHPTPPVLRVCVDMADGNRTDEVMAYARERRGVVVPARGMKRQDAPLMLRRLSPKTKVTSAVGQQYVRWTNGHFFAKFTAGMDAAVGARGASWLPSDVGAEHLVQIAATRLVARKLANGTIAEEWEEGDNNHGFDAECMAWVAAELAGVSRFVRRGVAGVAGGRAEELRRRKQAGGGDQSKQGGTRWQRGAGRR